MAVRSSVIDVRAVAACAFRVDLTWSSALGVAVTSNSRFSPIASRLLRTSLAALHTDSAHWVFASVGTAEVDVVVVAADVVGAVVGAAAVVGAEGVVVDVPSGALQAVATASVINSRTTRP